MTVTPAPRETPFSHDHLAAVHRLHNEGRAGSWKECGKGDSRPGGGGVCGGLLLFVRAVRVLTLTFPINEPLEGTGTGDAEQQEGRGGCGEHGEKKKGRPYQTGGLRGFCASPVTFAALAVCSISNTH